MDGFLFLETIETPYVPASNYEHLFRDRGYGFNGLWPHFSSSLPSFSSLFMGKEMGNEVYQGVQKQERFQPKSPKQQQKLH
jgi:hypothetical protein